MPTKAGCNARVGALMEKNMTRTHAMGSTGSVVLQIYIYLIGSK